MTETSVLLRCRSIRLSIGEPDRWGWMVLWDGSPAISDPEVLATSDPGSSWAEEEDALGAAERFIVIACLANWQHPTQQVIERAVDMTLKAYDG